MSVKGLEEKNYIVTTKEISEILSLSTRRIQQLANENALVKSSRGKFDLPASIIAYIDYLVEKEKPDEELDKYEEEAKWTRARRQKTELELQIMKGELHRSEDVKRVMNDMLGAFRARLLSLPSKTSPQILGKTDIPAIKEILKDAVYEAMNELSDYDPHVFYDYSKDKLYLDDEELEEEPEENELADKEFKHGRKKKKN
ncbi:hypothetical protein ACJ2A9_21350 [Anaerobacillus sp. MEB173]|uniref:hypothetical protein n=1 Tax=Anaerobacillus sp. MEB173 TaxID=3383345 RepID=UPI003F8FDBC5